MKGHTIPVKNGLLDPKHIRAMQVNSKTSAIWCYLWFLDKVTRVVDDGAGHKVGVVLGGKPITLLEIAEDLELDIKTVRKMYHRLKEFGYVTNARTPYGNVVTVTKAFKIFDKGRDLPDSVPELPQRGKSELPENGRSDDQKTVGLGSENGRSNKINQLDKPVDKPTTIVVRGKPEINELFKYWESELGYPVSGRVKANRFACSNLLKKYGEDKLKQLIHGVALASADPYGPRISDFSSLQAKQNDLVLWGRRQHQEAENNKAIII